MKHEVIEISSISSAIPKYKTWYKYYDDILVSVICHGDRNSYIRKKAKSLGHKTDSELCFWHSDWQYNKIESCYGLPITGQKTYEIVRTHEGEIHRIDSVIDNIAIEFQHSLGVALQELDSRFIAHKSLGYIPYLVLDFSDLLSDCLQNIDKFSSKKIGQLLEKNKKDPNCFSLLCKMRKWINSEYYTHGNLFIDFKDRMIRFSSKLNNGFLYLERIKFIDDIQNLENILEEKFQEEGYERDKIEQEKKSEELRKEISKRVHYLKRLNENKLDVESGKDFLFYRLSNKNKLIAESIESLKHIEYIRYGSYSKRDGDYLKKYHVYYIFSERFYRPIIELQYITNGIIKNNQYGYLHTDINIIKANGEVRDGIKRFTFRELPRKGIVLTSKRLEFVQNILHASYTPALYLYDKNGNYISKHYYLFNTEVTKEENEILSLYFETGIYLNNDDERKVQDILNKIIENDMYDFRKYFYQNDLPSEVLSRYYEEINVKQPLIEVFL